jgi:hypothetical protein
VQYWRPSSPFSRAECREVLVKTFLSRFPREAIAETRTMTVPEGAPLPAGTYGFLEFFCEEPGCDCRRVVVSVLSKETGRVMATLSYGWDTVEFYRKWSHDDELAESMAGVSLEPFGEQTQWAQVLLAAFREMISTDTAYGKRIQRHYQMFKRRSPRSGARAGS